MREAHGIASAAEFESLGLGGNARNVRPRRALPDRRRHIAGVMNVGSMMIGHSAEKMRDAPQRHLMSDCRRVKLHAPARGISTLVIRAVAQQK